MIVCESGGHANGLTYFIFRFLRRPQIVLGVQGLAPDKAQENAERYLLCSLAYGKFRRKFRSKSVCALLSANARGKKVDSIGKDYAASATALELKPIKKKPNPQNHPAGCYLI